MNAEVPVHDAVIVAGGQGSRLGGVCKASLLVAGQPMLHHALAASRNAQSVVVVGEVEVPQNVLQCLENPPGSGPAAGVAAGLDLLNQAHPSALTLVLACDLPGAELAAEALLCAAVAQAPVDGWCLTDSQGALQWLCGLYRTSALQAAAAALRAESGVANRSMRQLLSPLRLQAVTADPMASLDVDTWEDVQRWQHVQPLTGKVAP